MTFEPYRQHYRDQLEQIRSSGMWKDECPITSPQRAGITVADRPDRAPRELLNFCANNYLGLADHPEVIEAAAAAARRHGFGMASVRFICGTQDLHRRLEEAVSELLGTEETILYTSCFDANGAIFETLLGPEDAVLSDELNHASVIDGIRLSRARRRILRHGDLEDYARGLEETAGARVRLLVTDGVFSMHGDLAPLDRVAKAAEDGSALLVVDDSHATGVLGPGGRGTGAHFGVASRVDLVTSTFGKALGGGSGGFASGRSELVQLLRQRSRPYLFSNSVAPPIAGGALAAIGVLQREPERLERLRASTEHFRRGMEEAGFRLGGGEHPIVPILIGDEKKTVDMARRLMDRGIYVVGFTYPVVPRGEARIRVQLSAAHCRADIERAVEAFAAAAREAGGASGGSASGV